MEAGDRMRIAVVAVLVLPSLAATAVAALPDTVWSVQTMTFASLVLIGGVALSLFATPLAFFLAWYWRRDVSPRARTILWSLCWLSLAPPLLLLLQVIALENLS